MLAYADQYGNSAQMPAGAIALIMGIYVVIIGFMIFTYAKIVAKTGYSWAWVFIIFVPVVNIVMIAMLAFRQWPVQRELELTRRALEAATGYPFPPGSELAHYGKYQMGSGLQRYGTGQGYGPGQDYDDPAYAGLSSAGQPYSGQLYAGRAPADQGYFAGTADAGQGFGHDEPRAQAPSDNPYEPKG